MKTVALGVTILHLEFLSKSIINIFRMRTFPFENLNVFKLEKEKELVENELLVYRIRFKLHSLALETHMVWFTQELQLHNLPHFLPLLHHP